MKKILFLFLMIISVFLIAGSSMTTAAESPTGIEAALLSSNATAPIALDTANFMNALQIQNAAASKNEPAPAAQTTTISIYAENDSSAPLIHRLAMKRTLPASPADLTAIL